MRELILSANRANATIYTVDPRGLAGVVDAGTYVDQSEWRTHLQKTTSTLRYLAEETGGFAVVNTNDLAGELKRIDAETSDYYVLGFYSSNPDPDEADPAARRQGRSAGRRRWRREAPIRSRRQGSRRPRRRSRRNSHLRADIRAEPLCGERAFAPLRVDVGTRLALEARAPRGVPVDDLRVERAAAAATARGDRPGAWRGARRGS